MVSSFQEVDVHGMTKAQAFTAIDAKLRRAGGERLIDCTVFDVYTGAHIVEGKKSVAFSLTMRAEDQTLTDEHAEEIVRGVLTALKEKHSAEIR